jgi:hypothetical protein
MHGAVLTTSCLNVATNFDETKIPEPSSPTTPTTEAGKRAAFDSPVACNC